MKNTEMLLIFLRIIFKIKVEYNCDLPTLNLDNKVICEKEWFCGKKDKSFDRSWKVQLKNLLKFKIIIIVKQRNKLQNKYIFPFKKIKIKYAF